MAHQGAVLHTVCPTESYCEKEPPQRRDEHLYYTPGQAMTLSVCLPACRFGLTQQGVGYRIQRTLFEHIALTRQKYGSHIGEL